MWGDHPGGHDLVYSSSGSPRESIAGDKRFQQEPNLQSYKGCLVHREQEPNLQCVSRSEAKPQVIPGMRGLQRFLNESVAAVSDAKQRT